MYRCDEGDGGYGPAVRPFQDITDDATTEERTETNGNSVLPFGSISTALGASSAPEPSGSEVPLSNDVERGLERGHIAATVFCSALSKYQCLSIAIVETALQKSMNTKNSETRLDHLE